MTSNMLNVHSMLNASVFSPFLSHCSIFFLLSVALTTPQHLHYSRAAPENSSAILWQEQISLSKKKYKRGLFSFSATKAEMSLTNNALFSSFIPDTNIFFKSTIYKSIYSVCVHTAYSERLFLKQSWWRKTVSVGLHFQKTQNSI